MGFEALLGNARLKENLTAALARGRVSHFYLLSGPQGSGKRTLARLLSAAILCREAQRPCGACPACRKVLGAGHPDVITVEDPDHKAVAVKLVRQAREDMYVLPNEADRKIYIFPQELGTEGQNALLKILEEPPSYGVFLLLTDNPEKLLPTVRSRCTELALQALPPALLEQELARRLPEVSREVRAAAAQRSGGWLGQALDLAREGADLPPQTQAFLEAFAARDTYGLTCLLVGMEKCRRDALVPLLNQWIALLEGALVYRSGMPSPTPMAARLSTCRSAGELCGAIAQLRTCAEYAQGNVSPAAICGHLLWALR